MSEWKESLSLEETNAVRISLGLKPLKPKDDTSATPSGDQLAEDNFRRRKEAETKERETQALKDKLDRARNQRERGRKLVGKGLGEDENDGVAGKVKKEEGADDGAEDTKAWVKRQKRKQKELAEKRKKEEEEAEARLAEDAKVTYDERDLKGLKVAHGQEEFEEGEDTVLTLKDSRILDDEDDELHNLNLSENLKHAEALTLKKKGNQAGAYTGYDDDEFTENGGGASGVLKKYDEEINGKEEEGFRLGGAVPVGGGKSSTRKRVAEEQEKEEQREKVKLSMDYAKTFTDDYANEDGVGFKKPKKKKKRPMRVTEEDPDTKPIAIERTNLDATNLIDDDDLQLSLARARREQSKKKVQELKKVAAAARAAGTDVKVKKEDEDNDDSDVLMRLPAAGAKNVGGGGGEEELVLDDTSEFVRNITAAAEARRAVKKEEEAARALRARSESIAPSAIASGTATSSRVKIEESDDVPVSEMAGWGEAREDGEEDDYEMGVPDRDGEDRKPDIEGLEGEGTEGIGGRELLVSKGIASTLSILRHQGLLKEQTPEERERDHQLKERAAWAAKRRKIEEERERERLLSKQAGSSKDQQQREYENRMREQRYAQEEMQAYASYKPAVNITYHDEFGRNQTPKEAWKSLNYNFHGYGSGSKNAEKRLARIAAEKQQEAAAAGDVSAAAFRARAEKAGSATMILSTGNRGAAPNQDALLGTREQKLQKTQSTSSKDKDKERSAAEPVFSDIAMRPLPLPASETRKTGGFVRAFKPSQPTNGAGEGSGNGA